MYFNVKLTDIKESLKELNKETTIFHFFKVCCYLSLVQSRLIAASNSAAITYWTEPGEEFSPIETFDAV